MDKIKNGIEKDLNNSKSKLMYKKRDENVK